MNDQRLIPEMLEQLRRQLLDIHPDMATDEQLFADQLDASTDVLDQLRAILRYAVEADVFADAISNHMKVLSKRKQRFEGRADACRATVRDVLETLQLKRLEDPTFTATLSAGRTAVIVTDPSALPTNMLRVTHVPDLIAIGDALKSGATVSGATLNNAAPILTVRRI